MTLLGEINTASGIIRNGYELIEEISITADTSAQDFTSTISHPGYIIEANLVNLTSATQSYVLRMNVGSVVSTRQILYGASTTVSAGLATNNALAQVGASGTSNANNCCLTIKIPWIGSSLRNRFITSESTHVLTTNNWPEIANTVCHITTPAIGSAITSLGLMSAAANGIGSNSQLRLYGLVNK